MNIAPKMLLFLMVFTAITTVGCFTSSPSSTTTAACLPPSVERISIVPAMVKPGDDVVLSINVSGTKPEYLWLVNEKEIPNSNAPSILYKAPRYSGEIVITVQVVGCGQQIVQKSLLTVASIPTETSTPTRSSTSTPTSVPLDIQTPTPSLTPSCPDFNINIEPEGNLTVVMGQSLDLQATIDQENVQVDWINPETGDLSVNQDKAVFASNTVGSTIIEVRGIDICGHQKSDQVEVTVIPEITPLPTTPPLLSAPQIQNAEYKESSGQACFDWRWSSGPLLENQYYVLRTGPSVSEAKSRVWFKENETRCIFPHSLGMAEGEHIWYVVVIEDANDTRGGEDGKWREISVHSDHGTISIGKSPDRDR